MPDSAIADPTEDVETRVLAVVRELVEETGGQRALRALASDASLERDLGLGSLERAELLVRLEAAFGRTLSDDALEVDTPPGPRADAGRRGRARPSPRAATPATPQVAARAAAVDATTISESLWRHAQADPNRPHVYLRDGDGPAEVVTYGRLFAEASAVAGGLRDDGIRPGDTVALMLPTGLRLPARVPGHPARGRGAGADLPAGAARPARRVRRAPERDPGERGGPLADHDRPRARRRRHPEARGADAAPRDDRGRAGRPRSRGDDAGVEGRGRRLHPVHVGQHRPPQGRAAHARQPARQHPRDRRAASTCSRRTSACRGCRCTTTWGSSAPGCSACTTACRSTSSRRCRSCPGPSAGCGRSTSGAARSRPRPTSRTSCACAASRTRRSRGSISRRGASP